MMLTLKKGATKKQIDAIMKKIHELGFAPHHAAWEKNSP